jgi:hypothetical protein
MTESRPSADWAEEAPYRRQPLKDRLLDRAGLAVLLLAVVAWLIGFAGLFFDWWGYR